MARMNYAACRARKLLGRQRASSSIGSPAKKNLPNPISLEERKRLEEARKARMVAIGKRRKGVKLKPAPVTLQTFSWDLEDGV